MRQKAWFGLVLLCFIKAQAQTVVPFRDFNNFFLSYENGGFKTIEIQPVKEYQAGDELVAYIDTRGNLRLYDGRQRKDITNLNVEYQVSDHLLGYMIGPTLNMWDKGRLQTLTYFGRKFLVKDSLIVYEDTRFNTLNVYWKKNTMSLAMIIGELSIPTTVGENILVFKDNGNLFKVFQDGMIYEICAWNGTIDFQLGTDIICFNDPTTRTFVAFEHGEFIDVENQFMRKYKAGRGFVVYEDLNSNLWSYKNGEKTLLTNFISSFWDVKDDVVIWMENNYLYAYIKETKYEVARYKPESYMIKNDVVVYRDMMGGVTALVGGEQKVITTQMSSEFTIYGSSVLVELFNRSYVVLWKGKVYSI